MGSDRNSIFVMFDIFSFDIQLFSFLLVSLTLSCLFRRDITNYRWSMVRCRILTKIHHFSRFSHTNTLGRDEADTSNMLATHRVLHRDKRIQQQTSRSTVQSQCSSPAATDNNVGRSSLLEKVPRMR